MIHFKQVNKKVLLYSEDHYTGISFTNEFVNDSKNNPEVENMMRGLLKSFYSDDVVDSLIQELKKYVK